MANVNRLTCTGFPVLDIEQDKVYCSRHSQIPSDFTRLLRRKGTMDNRWVSVEEVAKHLGIARDTVYRWIDKRGLPAHQVGRLWKFQLSEVDEWVKSGKGQ